MANKNFQKKKIQDTKGSNFGKYQEGVGGGGSPQAKDPNKRAPGVNSNYREQNNDTMQPRTDDGKFTYKSVNGKSIDPKYGPSRGKTVNPLLTGGENGVMIDDVENEFSNKSGSYWDKYKDSWYQKGGEIVTSGDFKVRVAAEAIWEVAKRKYDNVKGEFQNEATVFDEVKKGRSSAEEKAAKQKAQSSGKEQAVIEQSTGGIKIKPGTPIPQKLPTQPKAQPAPTPGVQPTPTPVAPTPGIAPTAPSAQPTAQPTTQPNTQYNSPTAQTVANTASSLIHTKEQLDAARQLLTDNGVDLTGVTDEQLDGVVDEYIDFNAIIDDNSNDSDNSNENSPAPTPNPAPASSSENEEEDSDATKKIKSMGFSE